MKLSPACRNGPTIEELEFSYHFSSFASRKSGQTKEIGGEVHNVHTKVIGDQRQRAILMNASQLASLVSCSTDYFYSFGSKRSEVLNLQLYSYDFFKAELLKTPYFEDNGLLSTAVHLLP